MNRSIFSFLASISLIPVYLFAQPDSSQPAVSDTTPIGKITYLHDVHLSDDMDKNGVAVLLFNTTRSVYIHRGAPKDSVQSSSGKTYNIGDGQGFPIYKMHLGRKMRYSAKCYPPAKVRCIVEDTLGGIAWTLQPEHKRFGRYDCLRATGRFRGRDYEAWYTLDVPIPSGPFKLGRLPGLILEAYTTDRQVEFLFSSLEMSKKIEGVIKPPQGKETGMNYAAYQKAKWEYLDNDTKAYRAKGWDISVTPSVNTVEVYGER